MVCLDKVRNRLSVVADQFGGPSSARGIFSALLSNVAAYKRTGDLSSGTYNYCQKPYVSWYEFA